jgi:hypothetical protein
MQDQGGAVSHLAVQGLFQIALLRGREFIVGNDGVVLEIALLLSQLANLAFAKIGMRLR